MKTTLQKSARNCFKRVLLLLFLLLFLKSDFFTVSFESISSGYYSLTVSRIQATLEFLSSKNFKGRKTGTPEEDLTTAYLASVFRRNGLQPASTTHGTFIQEFELTQALPSPESVFRRSEPHQPAAEWKIGQDFLPAPWGTESPEVTASLAFVGYGITAPELGYDDYSKTAVQGKIAVALSKVPDGDEKHRWDFFAQKDYEEPLEKAIRAQARGAAGLIIILPFNESIPALETINYKLARTYLTSQVNQVQIPTVLVTYPVGESLFHSDAHSLELGDIQQQLNNGARPETFDIAGRLSLATRYDHKSFKGKNVLAVIPGVDSNLKQECLIISAHHDHLGAGDNEEIYFGADDDASGTTGLLELAAAFQGGNLRPRRSILLAAWGAEELGLLGSHYYVQQPAFPLSQTIAMLQLDMIGRNEERPANAADQIEEEKPQENLNTVSIAGTVFSPDIKKLIQSCNSRVNLKLRYRYDHGQENLLKRSDQWPFLEFQVPSVFFFTGFHPDYHKPSDTADKINYQKMERILQLVYLSAWEIADSPLRPGFVHHGSMDSKSTF